MRFALLHLSALLLGLFSAPSRAADLVFLAPTNHTEPLAHFEKGRLQSGLLKDLGEALARRAGLSARFVPMPSKRVGAALAAGEADVLCYVLPAWVPGEFHWFEGLIPDALLLARSTPAAPAALTELKGRKIGTVLGYQYPEVEAALGADFQRQDARDTGTNLDRLAAHQVDWALVERSALLAYQRRHPQAGLKESLVLREFSAGCLLSKQSGHSQASIAKAIQGLRSSGELARLLAPYGL